MIDVPGTGLRWRKPLDYGSVPREQGLCLDADDETNDWNEGRSMKKMMKTQKEHGEQTGVMRRIAELDAEIEEYRQMILEGEGALDSAEKELNDLLSELDQGECQLQNLDEEN